jgi:hypothetical protein
MPAKKTSNEKDTPLDPLFWTAAGYRPDGAPVFSRLDAVRRWQQESGRAPCFGRLGKFTAEAPTPITPRDCEDDRCPVRRECEGLHARDPFTPPRLREDGIELQSRLYFNARAFERRAVEHSPFQAEVADRVHHWSADLPQVAVLGAFSSGKSTLINRIVGQSLLPATRTPTTAVVTILKHGAEARARMTLRPAARVHLMAEDGRAPDLAALSALHAWLKDRQRFGVTAVLEETSDGLVPVPLAALQCELDGLVAEVAARTGSATSPSAKGRSQGALAAVLSRSVGARSAPDPRRLDRTFEVRFREDQVASFALGGCESLSDWLVRPEHALRTLRAELELPHPILGALSLVDTAGLCSPIAFHTSVTSDLFERKPDKVLVALDARRLDSPTNRLALEVLGRHFVSCPDDYRQVTFALTFWDSALRDHMVEDTYPPLPFEDAAARVRAAAEHARALREDLTDLLAASVGVPCPVAPTTFLLGLGESAPTEMKETLVTLRAHLESGCRNWVGVDLWARRWSDARDGGRNLQALRDEAESTAREDLERLYDSSTLATEGRAIEDLRATLESEVALACESVGAFLSERLKAWRAVVNGLDGRSELLEYVKDGFWNDANDLLNTLQKESIEAGRRVKDATGGADVLRPISLDRKLLGLDRSVRRAVADEVDSFGYAVASVWDFLLGGIHEFNASSRKAARRLLGEQVTGVGELLRQYVERWVKQARRIERKACDRLGERKADLASRRKDRKAVEERLTRRIAFLERSKPIVNKLAGDVARHVTTMEQAKARIEACRVEGFRVALVAGGREVPLRRGREVDVYVLQPVPRDRWSGLVVAIEGASSVHHPVAHGDSGRLHFDALAPAKSFEPPEGAHRLEVRLGSLNAIVRFERRGSAAATGRRGEEPRAKAAQSSRRRPDRPR